MINRIKEAIYYLYKTYIYSIDKTEYGHVGKNVTLQPPIINTNPRNVFLHDNVNIYGYSTLIIDKIGKFIMKKNSGCAQGLTVVTANHTTSPTIGKWHKQIYIDTATDSSKDVIIEEDVWIAAHVTLLPGVVIGRGAIVGAGAVCRNSIPPYSIVLGNPARIIGFKFTPEEIIQHECALYPEDERLSLENLERNYKKYYLNKIKDIAKYLKK